MSDKYNETLPTREDSFAASASDCTGLAPTPAHDEYEAESYENIYPYLPPIPPNPVTEFPDPPEVIPPTAAAKGIHNEII